MNLELLSKLYEQSHKTVPHKPISGFDARWEDRVFVPEVFAELIVRECADLYKNEDGRPWFDKFQYKEVLKIYSKQIKQHFGVEE